ncbi:HNH endonuclease [Pseudomonas nitroreducens]|nr:HNH endonuclease [Pseudomonas nitroreducens]
MEKLGWRDRRISPDSGSLFQTFLNGLLLAPHYDRLFDQGLISFSNEGSILLSRAAEKLPPEFGLSSTMTLRKVDPKHLPYLATHRQTFGYA